MGKSVLELSVETGKWDAGLKKAKQALDNFTSAEGGLQQALGKSADQMASFIQMLGNIDSTAKSTKGQLREYTETIASLTAAYRSMTSEQQQGDVGRAMAASIQQLTEKAGVLRDAMDDVQQSIKNTASDTRTFDQLAQGASVVTAGFQGLTGAGKMLGIEMEDNVEVIAKLQAAMAVTNSLTTIQNALQKQSALMQGVLAARATLAAAAQRAVAAATGDATKAQAAYNLVAKANPYVLLTTAVMGLVGAMTLFSSSADENAEKANNATTAIENMTTAAQNYIDIMRQLGASQDTLLTMGVDSAKKIYDAAVAQRQAVEKQIRDAMDSGDIATAGSLGKQLENARQAEKSAQANYGKALDARRSQAQYNQELLKTWDTLKSTKEINAAIQGFTKLRDEAEIGSAAWNMYNGNIKKLQDKLPKTVKTTKTTGGNKTKPDEILPEGSVAALEKQLSDIKKQQALATSTTEWDNYEEKIHDVTLRIKELKGELNEAGGMLSKSVFKEIMGKGMMKTSISDIARAGDPSFNKRREKLSDPENNKPIKVNIPKLEKSEVKLSDTMSQMAGGLSSVVSGIEALGIEIPDGLKNVISGIQTVTSILSGIATIVTAIQAIQAADAIVPFAHGGVIGRAAGGMVIPGTSYSGDRLRMPVAGGGMIGVNSGEVLLNMAQQNNLVSQFSGAGQQISVQPYVDGEKIFLGMNNTSKRMGRGEIVTTGMLRRLGMM